MIEYNDENSKILHSYQQNLNGENDQLMLNNGEIQNNLINKKIINNNEFNGVDDCNIYNTNYDSEQRVTLTENMNSFSDLNFHILQGKIKNNLKNNEDYKNSNKNSNINVFSFKNYSEMKNKIKSEIDIRENVLQHQSFSKILSYPTINLNEMDIAFNNLSMLGKTTIKDTNIITTTNNNYIKELPQKQKDLSDKEHFDSLNTNDQSIILERIRSIYSIEELKSIENLNISNEETSNVNGLDKMLNSLKNINLNNNRLSSFEGIPSSVIKLEINNNCLSSLEGLSNLSNIQYLNISNNSIENLQPLTSLINLRELHANDNNISDLSPLYIMKGLIKISLQNNCIKALNVDYINNSHYYWESLNLKKNNIKVVNGIEYLKCLKYLNCAFNQIKDLKIIHSISSLKILILNDNFIEDFDGRTFGNLEYLNIDNNYINKISNIYRLSNLKVLYIRNQNNGNINFIEFDHLINLKEIYISGNKISSLDLFSNNIYLDIFSANTCYINEIPPNFVNNLTNLKVLDLRYNNIETLINLKKLNQLKVLFLSGNKLKDFYNMIKSLEYNKNIEYLDIRYNIFNRSFYKNTFEFMKLIKKLYISKYQTNIHKMVNETEIYKMHELDYKKIKQWEQTDSIYCNELDDKIFIERAFYRSLIIINFKENLKILDGVTVSMDEINKSQKRIKKLKNILQKSLNSINEIAIDNTDLSDDYKALINKNKKSLTNLLSTIDHDINKSNDFSRLAALHKKKRIGNYSENEENNIMNNSTFVALDTCFNNLYLFEKNEQELNRTYRDLEKIENILKNITLKNSNYQPIYQKNIINNEHKGNNKENKNFNLKRNLIDDDKKEKDTYKEDINLSSKSKVNHKDYNKEKDSDKKLKLSTSVFNQNELSRSKFMKQINYDNDAMIKKLKRNIKENEKILFQRNIIHRSKDEKFNINNKNNTLLNGLTDNEYKQETSFEKGSSFWVPFDQSHELTFLQKQKVFKLNKRLAERANHIKRKHRDDIQSIIKKDDELSSWKPKYLPI
ncbi:L domain-like protein [Anaeromyces robustus]|uniref:L domain-like protein n=1 Tax=Anaeromyces robustus TaxID=1754192 RepID=A0A1Y1WVR2_9FUNG|nr:L domain-like protein [Anaeromyces robustus]|eukprot:ORX77552.1 L domain-like protein [Anaeromyces robustus]